MSGKRKKKLKAKLIPKEEGAKVISKFAEMMLVLAVRLTVLMESCGSLAQAERYGLTDAMSDDEFEIAFALLPVELGGGAETFVQRSMWNQLYPLAMDDPVVQSDIRQYRYWIATGVISEQKRVDPLSAEEFIYELPSGKPRLDEMMARAHDKPMAKLSD